MRSPLALSSLLLFSAAVFAQEATPEGEWQDEYGTTLSISLCGDDNTQICVVLLDVQGESRTEANLAYVNQQIMQADMVSPGEWRGSVVFEGAEADGALTHIAPDTIEIEGCRALIFCETLAFQRV